MDQEIRVKHQTDIDIGTVFDRDGLTIYLVDDVIYEFALKGLAKKQQK